MHPVIGSLIKLAFNYGKEDASIEELLKEFIEREHIDGVSPEMFSSDWNEAQDEEEDKEYDDGEEADVEDSVFDEYEFTMIDEASKVYAWFQNNNPQYYFLNGYAASSKSIFPICYSAFVKGSDRAAETVKLFNTVDEYIEQITDDEVTVYESELSAHRLIVDSIEYKSNEYDQSLYSAVELKETVCQGYANLFTVLMNGIGVDTLTCYSPVHAWNAIYLEPVFDPDGLSAEWFGVDCTWDDQDYGIIYKYFMTGI